MEILRQAKLYLNNIPGWHTSRKILVFESDDWGSIRMPSSQVFNILKSKGINVDSYYDLFDTIESKEDLEYLFDALTKFRSVNGTVPLFTFNTVMANPDFKK